jgi:hypothetical protein
MTHWGWYWRVKRQHIPKKLCDNLPQLDAFWVMKQLPQRDSETQRCTASINDASTYILITRQTCNFGGFRYFFTCPGCSRRMRFLYFDDMHKFFRCRRCLNLCYRTQRLRRTELYLWRRDAIENQLASAGGSLHRRPKGISTAAFRKLVQRHWLYGSKLEDMLEREAIAFYGNHGQLLSR